MELQWTRHRVPDPGWTEFHICLHCRGFVFRSTGRQIEQVLQYYDYHHTCLSNFQEPVNVSFFFRVVLLSAATLLFSTCTVLMGAAQQVWQLILLRLGVAFG